MSKETKKRKFTVWDLLFWLALAVMLVSAGVLGWKFWGYKQGQDAYVSLQQEYIKPQPPEEEKSPVEQVDLKKMNEQNPDVVGWIQINALGISYPILHGPDNDYYLHRLPDGKYNAAGSLFLDYSNKNLEDLHTLVYGHNMRDGSMLAGTLKYLNREFYEQNGGEVFLHTLDGVWRYELLSIAQVPPDDPIYTLGFSENEQYAKFLEEVKAKSVYETSVPVTEQDKLLTLSTCTKDGKNRIVFSAVRTDKVDSKGNAIG